MKTATEKLAKQGSETMLFRRVCWLSGVSAVACSSATYAQNTPAGTTISNQAQVTYTVNGTSQTTSSTIASFVVDRKANLIVERVQNAPTQVNLGQIGAITTFRVTNKTNGTQDFILDPDQPFLSLGDILPGTDNFDLSNLRAYVDDGDGVFSSATDTATFIDELPADTSKTVFLVGDVPTTVSAALAFVSLHVTVAAGGTAGLGGALVQTNLNVIDQNNEVDVVFADNDSDGPLLGDTVANGQGRAYAAYEIGTRNVDLTVSKTSRILSDGVSVANFKALPGAVVEYCFVVRNATLTAPATNVTLSDVVPANTTYVPGSIQVGGIPVGVSCLTGGVTQTDTAGDSSLGGFAGAFDAGSKTVTMTLPTVTGGGSLAASFQAKIN